MSSTVFKSIRGSRISVTNNVNQIILGSTNTVTINASSPSVSRTYTIPDTGANSSFIMSDLTQTINGIKSFSSGVPITATTNQLILGITNTTTITSPAPTASRIYTLSDVGDNANFIMSAGNQTIGGTKTFTSALTTNLTSNQLVLGTTNTTTINASAPIAPRTYTLPDTGANSSFVMTDLAQSIDGIKTFSAGTTLFRAPVATNATIQLNGNNTDTATTGYQVYVPSANNRITISSRSTGSDLVNFSDTNININKPVDITATNANFRTWLQNTSVATGAGNVNIAQISFSASMVMIAEFKVYSIDSGGGTSTFISTYEIKNVSGTVTHSLLFTSVDYDQTITSLNSASTFYLRVAQSGTLTKNVVAYINILNVSSDSFSIPNNVV